jgi:hypothetical protein
MPSFLSFSFHTLTENSMGAFVLLFAWLGAVFALFGTGLWVGIEVFSVVDTMLVGAGMSGFVAGVLAFIAAVIVGLIAGKFAVMAYIFLLGLLGLDGAITFTIRRR